MKMDKIDKADTIVRLSDYLDKDSETLEAYAVINQLAKIRRIKNKPQNAASSQKMFDTNDNTNTRSLPFEFDKIQNKNMPTEIICISSDSSSPCINFEENNGLTPRKSIVKNNYQPQPQCRKSLFKTIIHQDLKKKLDSAEKTLTDTNFSPQTFSTPIVGKKNIVKEVFKNNFKNRRIENIQNIQNIQNIDKDQQKKDSKINNSSTEALKINDTEKCDETLNGNIDCVIEKNNEVNSSKTKISPVTMEISNRFCLNVEIKANDINNGTNYKTQKIVIEDSVNNVEIENGESQIINNRQRVDPATLINDNSSKPNVCGISNARPSKIPKSKTPFKKSFKTPLVTQTLQKAQSSTVVLENASNKDDCSTSNKNTPNKSLQRSFSPPIPKISSPPILSSERIKSPIIIHQVFNNGVPQTCASSHISSNYCNSKVIDVQIIAPPPEFQSLVTTVPLSETDNIEKDITEDEVDLIIPKNYKKDEIEEQRYETILKKKLKVKLNRIDLNNYEFNKLEDNKKICKKVNEKISKNNSLVTDDTSHKKVNNHISKLNTMDKTNSNELYTKNSFTKNNENYNQNQVYLTTIPLDLRKKKSISKKKTLPRNSIKDKNQKMGTVNLQDYFPSTDENTFDVLLNAKNLSCSKKSEEDKRGSKKKIIRWPPKNRNDLGENKAFAFQEMNELEAAKKRKRYSTQNSCTNNLNNSNKPKQIQNGLSQNEKLENINICNNIETEANALNYVESTNSINEILINETNYRWPTPPPPIIDNFDLDAESRSSIKKNEIIKSPFPYSLRKRKLSVCYTFNVQPKSKKKRSNSRPTSKEFINSINKTRTSAALVLDVNDKLINDDPTAACQIWLDAANTIENNTIYSQKLEESKKSNKTDIKEYFQLPKKIKRISKTKEKRKLYKKGESDTELSHIENYSNQLTASITSKQSEISQVNCNELVNDKTELILSKASSEIRDNDTDCFVFKKPSKRPPQQKKNTLELQTLLHIHPMYKLTEDKNIQPIVDDNGNEIRRSNRKKAIENPIYDLSEYFKLYTEERKRKNNIMKHKKNNLTKVEKENTTNNQESRNRNNQIENNNDIKKNKKIDKNNEIGKFNNIETNSNDVNKTKKKKNYKKKEIIKEVVVPIDNLPKKKYNKNKLASTKQCKTNDIQSTLNGEAFQDNTNLISKRAHTSKTMLSQSKKTNLNKERVQLDHMQTNIEIQEIESEQYLEPTNHSHSRARSQSQFFDKLNQDNKIKNNHKKQDTENDQSIGNMSSNKYTTVISKKNKSVLSAKEKNCEKLPFNKPVRLDEKENKCSEIESNSDAQSQFSNPTENVKFFNWIMSFNCDLDRSKDNRPDLNFDNEGYRSGSLGNMIFETRHGVFYALYRSAVTSGYMKLLPGRRKPRAKSGRFSLKFLVLAGMVDVTINSNKINFEPGGHIEVEKGQMYSIENKSNEICCLYFTRISN